MTKGDISLQTRGIDADTPVTDKVTMWSEKTVARPGGEFKYMGDDGVAFFMRGESAVVIQARHLSTAVTASTANISIVNDLEPGDIIAGVTLADGDIVAVFGQTDQSENGIYTVTVGGGVRVTIDHDGNSLGNEYKVGDYINVNRTDDDAGRAGYSCFVGSTFGTINTWGVVQHWDVQPDAESDGVFQMCVLQMKTVRKTIPAGPAPAITVDSKFDCSQVVIDLGDADDDLTINLVNTLDAGIHNSTWGRTGIQMRMVIRQGSPLRQVTFTGIDWANGVAPPAMPTIDDEVIIIDLNWSDLFNNFVGTFDTPGAAGTAAGNDTELQFNDAGSLGASSQLTWNGSTLGLQSALAGVDVGHTNTGTELPNGLINYGYSNIVDADSNDFVVIGREITATGTVSSTPSLVMGSSVTFSDTSNSIVLGIGISRSGADNAVIIANGGSFGTSVDDSVVLGRPSNVSNKCVVIGRTASASASNATAVGYNARAVHTRSTALGQDSITTAIDQVRIGGDNDTSLSVIGSIATESTTASTSPTTGALTVAGGLGVAGAVQTGNSITMTGSSPTLDVIATSGEAAFIRIGEDLVKPMVLEFDGSGGDKGLHIYGTTPGKATSLLIERDTNRVLIRDTASSTSTTTGALVVSGGVGVAGAAHIGGALKTTAQVIRNVSVESATATDAVTSQFVVIDTSGITRTTPASPENGQQLSYRNISSRNTAGDVAIAANAGQTVDGLASFTLSDGESIHLIYDSTVSDWVVF